ncbi:MAG: M15 family metallopeptidase [Treponema sp.]|nr:M15 family metallopeptidase [Treponema sp.]
MTTKRRFPAVLFLLILTTFSFANGKSDINDDSNKTRSVPVLQIPVIPTEPDQLKIFKKAYPDVIFESEYDESQEDWKITLTVPNGDRPRIAVLYWSNGSLIPIEELPNKAQYWTLLYHYDFNSPLADPADFTEEQIAAMKKFGSNESRKNGAGTPMFFFDIIYDSQTRAALEKHIVKTTFLGKSINIHERIKAPLKKVEKQILELSRSDEEIQKFMNGLYHNEAYYWRLIANTNRKSFHSLGIAVDVLPKSYGGKQVYWSWAKDLNPDTWMLTPLKNRWMPPQSVIEIFEKEGFIWGGKWTIWDNMHFEYHPELLYAFLEESDNK